jgi:hypothetical protein
MISVNDSGAVRRTLLRWNVICVGEYQP